MKKNNTKKIAKKYARKKRKVKNNNEYFVLDKKSLLRLPKNLRSRITKNLSISIEEKINIKEKIENIRKRLFSFEDNIHAGKIINFIESQIPKEYIEFPINKKILYINGININIISQISSYIYYAKKDIKKIANIHKNLITIYKDEYKLIKKLKDNKQLDNNNSKINQRIEYFKNMGNMIYSIENNIILNNPTSNFANILRVKKIKNSELLNKDKEGLKRDDISFLNFMNKIPSIF
jgi:hypothetical protein